LLSFLARMINADDKTTRVESMLLDKVTQAVFA